MAVPLFSTLGFGVVELGGVVPCPAAGETSPRRRRSSKAAELAPLAHGLSFSTDERGGRAAAGTQLPVHPVQQLLRLMER